MKKISVTGAALALLVTGSVFVSCKNNPSPTTGTAAIQTTEPVPTAPATVQNVDGTATTTTTGGTITDTSAMANTTASNTVVTGGGVCGDNVKTTRKVAYTTRHRAHRHTVTKHKEVETSVAVVETPAPEPTSAPVAVAEPIVTPTVTTVYEKQNTFTGNVQPAPKKRMLFIAPEIGFNLNNMYATENYDNTASNMLQVGFHAGIMLDANLNNHWALQPSVRYSMKGGEITSSMSTPTMSMDMKDKLTLHYVEMPVNIVYKFGMPGSTRFMVGAGPYIALLASAQDKTKLTMTGSDGNSTVDEGQTSLPIGHADQTGNMRRVDWGAGGFLGVETACGMYVKAGGELGLLDLQKGSINNTYYNRNYNFLLTVGYLLGK